MKHADWNVKDCSMDLMHIALKKEGKSPPCVQARLWDNTLKKGVLSYQNTKLMGNTRLPDKERATD